MCQKIPVMLKKGERAVASTGFPARTLSFMGPWISLKFSFHVYKLGHKDLHRKAGRGNQRGGCTPNQQYRPGVQ